MNSAIGGGTAATGGGTTATGGGSAATGGGSAATGGGTGTGGGGCISEADSTLCSRLLKNCGVLNANDNCGHPRMAQCGTCQSSMSCGGGGVSNVCWAPSAADGGVTVNITGAIAITLGSSGRLYALDSAGGTRQAVFGTTVSSAEVMSGNGVYFSMGSSASKNAAAINGTVYRFPTSGVIGARPNGELVMSNGQIFSPTTGNYRPIPVSGTVSSLSGDHVIVVAGGLRSVVNLSSGAAFPINGADVLELDSTHVLLGSADGYGVLQTVTGMRTSGTDWDIGVTLSPNGAADVTCGIIWISPSGAATRCGAVHCPLYRLAAQGDWGFGYSGIGTLDNSVCRRSTNIASTVLPTILVDDATVHDGVVLFVGLEQGLPVLGRLDALTGVVTRWTPPERLLKIRFLKP